MMVDKFPKENLFCKIKSMDSARYKKSMGRFVHPKPYRADAVFPPPEKGKFERTQALTFTGESGELELKMVNPQRNVVGLELTSLFMVNPFISISNINCCLSYYLVANATGANPMPGGTAHFILLETGDFDPIELVEKLNEALFERHAHRDFLFSYDKDSTHKVTLTNTHATDTFYIPSKTALDTMLSASPLNNTVGSIWGSLGFAVDALNVELRATDARTAGQGQNQTLPVLPTEFLNKSDIGFMIPDDDAANSYSAVTASYVLGNPMQVSGKSALLAEQFLLYNNPFSLSKSKKNIYLVAKSIDTNHEIVSAKGTIQSVRRRRTVGAGSVVDGVITKRPVNIEEKASAYAPIECATNIEGVLAVIPVISGQVDLVSFSSKKIDLTRNPIVNFKNLRLQLLNDDGNVVDMRGRSITATITATHMY